MKQNASIFAGSDHSVLVMVGIEKELNLVGEHLCCGAKIDTILELVSFVL